MSSVKRPLKIEHILVPYDFGEPAQSAFAHAVAWAERLGAAVTVLHVYEAPNFNISEGLFDMDEYESTVRREAQTALDELAARPRACTVDVDTVLRRGSPWAEIVAVADESNADLIVMGTQGRRGIAHALLGSVAERVVRTACCPVLTVHGS